MARVKPWLRKQGNKKETIPVSQSQRHPAAGRDQSGSGRAGEWKWWQEHATAAAEIAAEPAEHAAVARDLGGGGPVVAGASSNMGQLWGESGGWDRRTQQRQAAAWRGVTGRQQVAVSKAGEQFVHGAGGKGVLFCRQAILKETPCPSQAP